MKRSFRLGFGEFVPAGNSLPADFLRLLFMKAVFVLLPSALQKLEALRSARRPEPAVHQLRAWSARYHLTDEWCGHQALAVAGILHDEKSAVVDSEIQEEFLPAELALDLKKQHEFIFCEPDLLYCTWKDYEEATVALFRNQLNKIHTRLEEEARDRNLVPTPVKRQSDHFLWLAGFQSLGWSINSLALASSLNHVDSGAQQKARSTVGEAIAELAEAMGLTLRNRADYDRSQTVDVIREQLDRAETRFP
jgi:hypothetical protein